MGKKKNKKHKEQRHITEVRLQLQRFHDVKIISDETGLHFTGTPEEPEIIEIFPIENEAEFVDDCLDAFGAFGSFIAASPEKIQLLDSVHHAFSRSDDELTVYTVMVMLNGKLHPAYSKKSLRAIDRGTKRQVELKERADAEAEEAAAEVDEALQAAGYVTGDAASDPPLGPTPRS